VEGRITRDYAATSYGQLLVRRAGGATGSGDRDALPLLMLHASPGSGEMLAGLIWAMASDGRRVLALDTLGNGDSDKPHWDTAEIADYARVVLEAADALELPRFDLYGSHTGALIAAEVAIGAPERVSRLILDGVTLFDAAETADLLANYTPPLHPSGDGTHLLFAWSFLRDQLLYWPWYRRTADSVRLVEPAGPDELQRWLLELLKSGETYPIAYRAAFRYPTRARMPLLRTPTLMVADASDMLLDSTARAAKLAPGATFARLAGDLGDLARVLTDFLEGAG
jgi:pimeloyl-ACP methyl ester carboxylesterase